MPAAQADVFTVLLPLTAGAVGVFVLGEPLGRQQAVALALALIGLWLATRPSAVAPVNDPPPT